MPGTLPSRAPPPLSSGYWSHSHEIDEVESRDSEEPVPELRYKLMPSQEPVASGFSGSLLLMRGPEDKESRRERDC